MHKPIQLSNKKTWHIKYPILVRTGSLEAEDLVLVLDDKSEIEVGREFISSASPVFAAMLGGGFKESTKSRYLLI